MNIYYGELIVMTILGSIASLFLKKASVSTTIIGLIRNINIYIGGILYLASAVLNIIVLQYLDYSTVLPLTSLTYIWTMILSKTALDEVIDRKKIIGVILIAVGIVFIAI